MKVSEIVAQLEEFCPTKYACEWDHVGLHVGRMEQQVSKVYITLDVTEEAIAGAIECGAQMIIAHHPLLFHGISDVNDSDFMGNRVITMIEQGISCYCMHTNFDIKGGMAESAAKRIGIMNPTVLEPTMDDEGLGRIGDLEAEVSLHELCVMVKNAFGLDHVNYYGPATKRIRKAAVLPGSGKDEVGVAMELGADVLVTGDMTYHVALDANAQGLAIIDAGHYGIEQIFMELTESYLREKMPQLEIVTAVLHNPRRVV